MFPVSKVLDRRSDLDGRVQFLVRWKNYGSKYDSWVDEENVNELVKLAYFKKNTGIQGIRQTLEVLVSQKLKIRHCQAVQGQVTVKVSVTMPMDPDTFADLFGCLPSAPRDLRQRTSTGRCRFQVAQASELDLVLSKGWSENTFRTSTTCRVMLNMPLELSLSVSKKVFFDHSSCPRCVSKTFKEPCKPVKRTVTASSFMKMAFRRERSHKTTAKIDGPLKLSWAKPRGSLAEKKRKKQKK